MHVKGDSSAQTGQTCNVILCLVIAIVAELVDLQNKIETCVCTPCHPLEFMVFQFIKSVQQELFGYYWS